MGLQSENADHGLVVVANIGALRRMHPFGNPPQAKQTDHVIDTQAARMPQDRGDGFPEWRVRGSGEAIRPPRRLIPVLPLLVEGIRRAAYRNASGITVVQAPGICASGTHTHWQIMHHPKRHASPQGRLLRGR